MDRANQNAPFNYLVTLTFPSPTNQSAPFIQTGHALGIAGKIVGVCFDGPWLPIYYLLTEITDGKVKIIGVTGHAISTIGKTHLIIKLYDGEIKHLVCRTRRHINGI